MRSDFRRRLGLDHCRQDLDELGVAMPIPTFVMMADPACEFDEFLHVPEHSSDNFWRDIGSRPESASPSSHFAAAVRTLWETPFEEPQ